MKEELLIIIVQQLANITNLLSTQVSVSKLSIVNVNVPENYTKSQRENLGKELTNLIDRLTEIEERSNKLNVGFLEVLEDLIEKLDEEE